MLFVNNATPSTITAFHDLISNELPTIEGKWSFQLKIFLNNKYSKPTSVASSQVPSRYLYTLQLSYLPGKAISIINNTKALVTTTQLKNEEKATNYDLEDTTEVDSVENDRLRNQFECGAATDATSDPWNVFISTKLQSLWNLKQTIKGEGGNSYVVSLGNITESKHEVFRVRTTNCFLHGVFKGFLIEIESLDSLEGDQDNEEKEKIAKMDDKQRLIYEFSVKINKIKRLIEVCDFPQGKLCFNVLSDSKLDHYSDLCQQYSDALQF